MPFKEKLKEARTQAGLTQLALAEMVGLTKQTITKYETGIREPDLVTLDNLASALGVNVDYLLDRPQKKNAPASEPTEQMRDMSDVDIQLLALPADVKLMVVQLVERLSGETEVPRIELDEVTRKQVVREVRAQEAQSQQESSDAQEQRSH